MAGRPLPADTSIVVPASAHTACREPGRHRFPGECPGLADVVRAPCLHRFGNLRLDRCVPMLQVGPKPGSFRISVHRGGDYAGFPNQLPLAPIGTTPAVSHQFAAVQQGIRWPLFPGNRLGREVLHDQGRIVFVQVHGDPSDQANFGVRQVGFGSRGHGLYPLRIGQWLRSGNLARLSRVLRGHTPPIPGVLWVAGPRIPSSWGISEGPICPESPGFAEIDGVSGHIGRLAMPAVLPT